MILTTIDFSDGHPFDFCAHHIITGYNLAADILKQDDNATHVGHRIIIAKLISMNGRNRAYLNLFTSLFPDFTQETFKNGFAAIITTIYRLIRTMCGMFEHQETFLLVDNEGNQPDRKNRKLPPTVCCDSVLSHKCLF